MFIYTFLLNIIYYLTLPFINLKFKGKERKERLGKPKLDFDEVIWVHAASVGEVNAVKPLLSELLTNYPDKNFILTTMTTTGQEVAKKISPKLMTIFVPIDFPIPMWKAFRKLKPELILLVETELWPVMLYQAKRRNIPVCIVNGRISERSFKRYKNMSLFWKPLFKSIHLVNAQSQTDKDRFEALGFNNVTNTHNLKFSVNFPKHDKSILRKKLGFDEKDYLIIWGSSRPGEEKLLKKIYPILNREITNLKIVVVPRHLTRIHEIKDIFKDTDLGLYSSDQGSHKITIVDEMGILILFYCIADLSIVGGSFYDFGGHNPLESAFYGSPTIIGKYHSSCKDSVVKLLTNKAIIVSNRKELEKDILKICNDKERAVKMGNNAMETVKENSDSLEKNLNILRECFKR